LRALDSDTPPVSERELLLPAQRANESLMLSLRRDTGLDVCTWEARHGLAWGDRRHRIAERLIAVGQASWDRRRLALTAAGFLVADAVAERLMVRQPEVSHEPISATAPPSA
jgi:coproporphyrinogen III oxidase-like Fe-S oxidoreductase